MQIKDEIRKEIKQRRKFIVDKAKKDCDICQSFLNSHIFKSADTILCYSSLKYEISTDEIINGAFALNKTVALPYCTDKDGNMDFYIIDSTNDLVQGAFGIAEPDVNKCEKLQNFETCVIVVPGLCFSHDGKRLGYGKGYYDRFLQNNTLISVGLCYNTFIRDDIPTGEFDKNVDFVITEKDIFNCKNDL